MFFLAKLYQIVLLKRTHSPLLLIRSKFEGHGEGLCVFVFAFAEGSFFVNSQSILAKSIT